MRRSDVPREELSRYDREITFPSNNDLYRSRRRELYPETGTGSHPHATRVAHERYHARQSESTAADSVYNRVREQERHRVTSEGQLAQEYYARTSAGLHPRSHRTLEPLAGRVGDTQLRLALPQIRTYVTYRNC